MHPADNGGMVTMTDVSSRRRQPAGVPTGGEFAENLHDEATSPLVEAGNRYAHLEVKTGLTPKELLAEAKKAAAVYGERKALPEDDIEVAAMETVANIWATYGSKGQEMDGALVNHVARIVVGKTIRGGAKPLVGDNAMALTEFKDTVEKRQNELGRALSSREKDEIAETIRVNWRDQKRKPTEGYHLFGEREVSVNRVPGGSFDATDEYIHPALIDPYSPEAALDANPMDGKATPAMDEALSRIEGAEGPDRTRAVSQTRRDMWRIISTDSGVPPVRAKLPEAMRKTVGSMVKSQGVSAIISRYDEGVEDRSTDALFLPFRESNRVGNQMTFRRLSESEKEEIVGVLRRNPSVADALWTSALASAK